MLYVYCGTNEIEIRARASAHIEALKAGTAEAVFVTTENYTSGILTDLLESVSLFGGARVIVFDILSEEKEYFEAVIERREALAASPNHFVIIERTLNPSLKKQLTAVAHDFHEYARSGTETFNPFTLTDALLTRNKKRLWLLLNEAWREHIPNEEIVGILFWQIKILRLVEQTKNAEEAGQKPFVYQKAKRALSNFKKGEIDQMSRDLLTLYHEGHMGKIDMSIALEKWVLQV